MVVGGGWMDGWMVVVMMGVGEGEEATERIDGWEDGWMDEHENGLIGLGGPKAMLSLARARAKPQSPRSCCCQACWCWKSCRRV